jgi:hypothetical protein
MFSVITNIYNKKIKGPTLMELFTATGKLKTFFLTTRDSRLVHHRWRGTLRYDIQVLQWPCLKARIIAAVKNIDVPMLTRVWQELEYRIEVAVSHVVHTSNISSCKKKFSFPVAVNNSIKVVPLIFLL